jgi:membrane associated rhomboid family serine protease
MVETMTNSIKIIIGFITVIWCIHLISWLIPLQQFGLIPRTIQGLFGIISSPFLHGSFKHLVGNTISLFVLAMILSLLEGDKMITKLVSMILIGGCLTWLFARSANHIGASGLIFSIWGYILLSAWFSRKAKYIWLSIIVVFLYGGMIFGIFPLRSGVSWEGHLFGLIAGIYLAWFYHKKTALTSNSAQRK